jgi:hypothetical protein
MLCAGFKTNCNEKYRQPSQLHSFFESLSTLRNKTGTIYGVPECKIRKNTFENIYIDYWSTNFLFLDTKCAGFLLRIYCNYKPPSPSSYRKVCGNYANEWCAKWWKKPEQRLSVPWRSLSVCLSSHTTWSSLTTARSKKNSKYSSQWHI